MAETRDYLAKAWESLAGAENELLHRRFNNCARGAYYACFQAAVAALLEAVSLPETQLAYGVMTSCRRALLAN
jgi:uncharacterized protein (UPF0332 family)